jgi:hypothetical protein
MSYKEKIVSLLEYKKDWVPAYDLEKVDSPMGWIGSSGSRRARELHAESVLERRLHKGYAEYRLPLAEPQQVDIFGEVV